MKHLLTALIATLFLVLPLHADEPTQTISVRVIDQHEQPIAGLGLAFQVGEETLYGLTDEDGLLGPMPLRHGSETSINVTVQPESHLRFGRWPLESVAGAWLGKGWGSEFVARHRDLVRAHVLPSPIEFKADEAIDGVLTLKTLESVLCNVRLRFDEWPPPIMDGHLMMGGLSLRYVGGRTHRLDEFELRESVERDDTGGKFIREHALAIPRNQSSVLVAQRSGEFFVLEIDQESTNTDSIQVNFDFPLAREPFANATFVARAGDPPNGYALARPNGEKGFSLPAPLRPILNDVGEAPRWNQISAKQYDFVIDMPSGDYLIVPHGDSLADTLLRLRRGEDLPHLKRITIPEGGTVELSTEDFLAQPAEPEAKDATP